MQWFHDEDQHTHDNYYAELLNAVPAGILVTTTQGIITYANTEVARLFGYEVKELINISIDQLVPQRFLQNHAQYRHDYAQNPSPRNMGAGRELFGLRKDHSEFPLEIGLRPLTTSTEPLIVATIVDISARKQAETRFANMIEASPYGNLLVDKHGTIQLVNSSLLRLFGYSADELLGNSMDILLPERYRDMHKPLRENYTRDPSLRAMGLGRDLTGRHKNGTEIPIEIGLNPIASDKGSLILAVITDITERKKLELNLKQANAHLEEFTYVASHDLKSPLRGISDLVDWIKEDLGDQTPEAITHNISRIKVRINRMERLIDDLLIYARAGKRSKEAKIFDVAALITGIIELHPVPPECTITQEINIPFIHAAKTPLETVLRNLFSNALKHNQGEHPRIDISAEASGNYCLFTVKDNGPGIPEAAQERVFRLFQTLGASKSEGNGIGLALAKRLTESHGGKIELSNNLNQSGCCFKVWWPRFARRDIDE